MRVRQILMVLAAASLVAGCSESAELTAPGLVPAMDGGIHTIGSGGKETTTQPSGTSSDSTTLRGIHTIGSNG